MKNKILWVLLLLPCTLSARSLRFVYIAHDVDTPVQKIVSRIDRYSENLEEEASSDDEMEQVIVYLSSGSNPVVANMKSGDTDNDKRERIVNELYERNYHEVETDTDLEEIIKLLADNDFLTADGKLDVSSLKFDFYVTPNFWVMHHNESLIASLFFILGLDRFYDVNSPSYTRAVSYHTYFPSLDDLTKCIKEDGTPFGMKNLNNINHLLQSPDFIGSY